ncbi:MAG: anti-sigma factor [Candidatus Binatia bacterium]
MTCEAYHDLLAPHIDGLLIPEEQQAVDEHLQSCTSCAELFTSETRFQTGLASHQLLISLPADVEHRLLRALAAERSPTVSWRERFGQLFTVPRFAIGAVAISLLGLLLVTQFFSSSEQVDQFALAMQQYEAVATGQLALAHAGDSPQSIENAFNQSGRLDFVTHVLDLHELGYQLKGGQILNSHGRPTALVLYESPDGPLVCLRQRGTAPPPPPHASGTRQKYLYSQANYTMLFSQFSDHFCVLITHLPQDQFRQRFGLAHLGQTSTEG